MARPLRLEFAGALYHVTARGDRQEDVYLDEADRKLFLSLLGEVCDRFNWAIHAYCLMTNHYHLLVETPDANLSRGMRQLNGVYTQSSNRRHRRVGHVFQGRYKAILVQKEAYLLELSRYVVLNPVRARMVAKAGDWPWSNYRASIGEVEPPAWLDVEWLLSRFNPEPSRAIIGFTRFVADGVGRPSPMERVRHQVLLGDDAFEAKVRALKNRPTLREVPMVQRRPLAWPLHVYAKRFADRDEALACAYRSGAYSMQVIADHFGVHYRTVSRAVRRFESAGLSECQT